MVNNNMSTANNDLTDLLNHFNDLLNKAPFINTDYANPDSWEADFRHLYIKELDIVDYQYRDSSFQYFLISNTKFKLKVSEYVSLIKGKSESDLLDFMAFRDGHPNFNKDHVEKRLNGAKESYRLAFHIVALEYRALIEAIRINKLDSVCETAIQLCHRCLASSFNPNYHQS